MLLTIFSKSALADEIKIPEEHYNILGAFLEAEALETVDSVDTDVQSILNSKGVFNSEIEQIESEFLENIQNADVDDISVITEYVIYNEDSNNNLNVECILDIKEVDSFISELYLNDETGEFINSVDYNESPNIILYSSNSSANALMKKTLIATTVTRGGKRKLCCTYICNWLTTPSERMNDVATIGWGAGQGSFDYTESYSATYSYICDTVWYTPNNNNTYTKHTASEGYEQNLSSSMRNEATENSLSCKATLRNSLDDVIGTTIYYYTYRNHTMSMNFYLTNVSNTSYTYLVGEYFHQKKSGSFKLNGITASYNVLTNTVSLTISGGYNWTTYYEKVGSSALLNHQYK